MVEISIIKAQLNQLGIRLSSWFEPEVRELQQILMEDEKIVAAAAGRYFGGMALLVATEQRLLLIDKRLFFMTVEDTRYDMISEINFGTRMLDASVRIFTVNKQHVFTSIRYKRQLRDLTSYVQQRVWELRQYQTSEVAPPAQPAMQINPAPAVPLQPVQPEAQRGFRLPLRVPKPHMPQRIGFAAVNGSRRYTPNIYAQHIAREQRFTTPSVE